MGGRHELKHYINAADYAQIRARLRIVAKLDENAGEGGIYKVRSLYFDNYADKAVVEKLSGLSRREKFRLRYYNDNRSFIRLERKSKVNRQSFKESAVVTMEQCEALLTGDYYCLKSAEPLLTVNCDCQKSAEPLLVEFYTKIRYQHLRPKSIVDYNREAYTYRAGNVRVTFDSNIRTSGSVKGFLNPKLATIPAADAIIMEVKYDGFLPDIIRDIVKIGNRNQTEFSKYVVARLV